MPTITAILTLPVDDVSDVSADSQSMPGNTYVYTEPQLDPLPKQISFTYQSLATNDDQVSFIDIIVPTELRDEADTKGEIGAFSCSPQVNKSHDDNGSPNFMLHYAGPIVQKRIRALSTFPG